MSLKFFSGKQDGFTIIELLVVIIVIGILAGIAVVAYPKYQENARDTKRKSDLHAIGDAYKAAINDGKTIDIGIFAPNFNSSSGNTDTMAGNLANPGQPGGVLGDMGYLANTAMDPTWISPPDINVTSSPEVFNYSGYILIPCWNKSRGVYLFARLENPSASDISKVASFISNDVDDIPYNGSNPADESSCFHSPAGFNLKEEDDRNHGFSNIFRASVKTLLKNSNNGYNYMLNIK